MDYFTSKNYVITLADGSMMPNEWKYAKRMMDRFMIPAEHTHLYNLANVYVADDETVEPQLNSELFYVEE
jgi:hypothetical protein